MSQYSEQDLRYAAEFRADIHREVLAIVRRTRPDAAGVIDPHPVEDYFQQHWDYPGKWYTIVAIPEGYRSRDALVDAIVRGTLASLPAPVEDAAFYALLDACPGCAVDYCVLSSPARYAGEPSHRAALAAAWQTRFNRDGAWRGRPARAVGTPLPADALLSSDGWGGELSYRGAFLCPPHGNGCTETDFERVNAALFPNGTEGLSVYRWTTDWSDYFDDGHEWWGTLCLTVYDKSLDRFAVLLASETD